MSQRVQFYRWFDLCLAWLAALLLLSAIGCAPMRQAAAAATQAQQAGTGAAKIAAGPEMAQALADLEPEKRAQIEKLLAQIVALGNQVASSLSPVIARLTVDDPAAPVRTTVDQAVSDTAQFVADAQMQAGRAEAEVEQAHAISDALHVAASYGQAIAGSLMSQLLLGTGGAGLVAAAGAIAVRVKSSFGTLKRSLEDAVQFGSDALAVDPKDSDQVAELKERHKAKQAARGTIATIKQIKAAHA